MIACGQTEFSSLTAAQDTVQSLRTQPDFRHIQFRFLSVEATAQGSRTFLPCSYGNLFGVWAGCQGSARCLYEVITGSTSCHLFLDLECKAPYSIDELNQAVLDIVAAADTLLAALLNPPISVRSEDWLELDATVHHKFSRHLILQLPGFVFPDISTVGRFVIDSLLPALNRVACDLVDTGIYNSNRQFRTYGSSKFADPSRPLRLSTRWGWEASFT